MVIPGGWVFLMSEVPLHWPLERSLRGVSAPADGGTARREHLKGVYKGTSPIRKCPPPLDPPRILVIGLL